MSYFKFCELLLLEILLSFSLKTNFNESEMLVHVSLCELLIIWVPLVSTHKWTSFPSYLHSHTFTLPFFLPFLTYFGGIFATMFMEETGLYYSLLLLGIKIMLISIKSVLFFFFFPLLKFIKTTVISPLIFLRTSPRKPSAPRFSLWESCYRFNFFNTYQSIHIVHFSFCQFCKVLYFEEFLHLI